MDHNKMFVSQFMKTEKIPFTRRLQSSAASLFGQVFAGLAMICVAPFTSLSILFQSKREVLDLDKLPVSMVGNMPQAPMAHPTTQPPTDEQVAEANQQIQDMFDIREPWKKAHDEEYGEEEQNG
jgi:hypothetical protein